MEGEGAEDLVVQTRGKEEEVMEKGEEAAECRWPEMKIERRDEGETMEGGGYMCYH